MFTYYKDSLNRFNDGVSAAAKEHYDTFIKLLNAKQINILLKVLNTSCSGQLQSDKCRIQLKQIINLDLQEPRTHECLELIRDNIYSARDKIFKIQDVKECMKFIL